MRKLTLLPERFISMAAGKPGLLALVVAVVAAGVLVFYLVILPPVQSYILRFSAIACLT